MRRRFRLRPVLAIGGLIALSPGYLTHASGDNTPDGPRVVAAWAAGPFEARVAFDQPVGGDLPGAIVGRSIVFDESRPNVRSRPAPKAPAPESLGSLNIAAARLEDGGRTLVVTTDPHPRAGTYTIKLPLGRSGNPVEVAYDLSGVEVSIVEGGEGAPPAWSGWWPTLDPAAVQADLAGSAGHARGLALLGRPGRLVLDTLVTLPKGPVTLTVSAPAAVEATLGGEAPGGPAAGNGHAAFQTESNGEPTPLSVAVPAGISGGKPLTLRAGYREDKGPETGLTPDRLMLPWVPAPPPPPAALEDVPDLSGGDPRNGAAVFSSGDAKCSTCHRVRGVGGNVGPDLSGLVGRDRKEVYRDIAEPSARINADYVPYTVALNDGRVLVGTVRAEGAGAIRVADTEAKVTVVPRAQIEAFRPSATSVMPVGLAGVIGEQKLRDLIAFLTTPPAD
jgi:putative heme-binding domain-containing protein